MSSMTEYEKVSYRQVGKSLNGKVFKGAPNSPGHVSDPKWRRPRAKRTTASIPSKFETTLHSGSREQDAFGGRTHRFHDKAGELPGPGNYHKQTTMVKSAETCGSISHLGFGVGFVSKTQRFSDRKEREDTINPGPGQYSGTFLAVGTRSDFSRGPATSSFAKPIVPQSSTRGSNRYTPGPGEYNVAHPATAPARVRNKRSSTFQSTTKRGQQLPSRDAPAPGHYDVPTDTLAREAGSGKLPSAAFRSGTERGVALAAGVRDIPGPGAYNPAALASAGTWGHNVGKPRGGLGSDPRGDSPQPPRKRGGRRSRRRTAAAQSGVPGRNNRSGGEQSQWQRAKGAAAAAEATRARRIGNIPRKSDTMLVNGRYVAPNAQSSMFSNTGLDRFGKPYLHKIVTEETPGPGTYLKPKAGERTLAASSFFMSSTGRSDGRFGIIKPPGPAFYKPDSPSKKSFLLNSKRRWL